jgi:hypothetical protein
MTASPDPPQPARRYSFSPLEKRGVLLGLEAGQVVTLVTGVLASLVVSRMTPGPVRVPVTLVLLGATAGAALCHISGRTLLGWMPLMTRWLVRLASAPGLSAEPEAGRVPGAATGRLPGPVRGQAALASGVSLVQVPAEPGGQEIGMWRDSRFGTLGAVLPVKGTSFALLDPDVQVQRLDAWRAVLGMLARPGSPLHRVQWVQASAPDGPLRAPIPAHHDPGAGAGGRARDSYVALVERAGPATQVHEVWIALAVGAVRRAGPDGAKAVDALLREVRLLAGQLRAAGLQTADPLKGDEIAALIGRPMAVKEEWSALRVDHNWHATYWVAEWPRVEVPPDFLSPLLMAEGQRSVSVVMSPVPPSRAVREARSARTADLADAELRSRAGFLTSARRQREADGAVRREGELADGHAEYRFSGYVTVTASDRAELDVACAETEHAAESARLELRRLYGRQAESFTWTLPLARGLA